MKRRGLNLEDLTGIIEMLQNGQALPPENRDHELVGDFAGFRDFHLFQCAGIAEKHPVECKKTASPMQRQLASPGYKVYIYSESVKGNGLIVLLEGNLIPGLQHKFSGSLRIGVLRCGPGGKGKS